MLGSGALTCSSERLRAFQTGRVITQHGPQTRLISVSTVWGSTVPLNLAPGDPWFCLVSCTEHPQHEPPHHTSAEDELGLNATHETVNGGVFPVDLLL